MVQFLNVTDNLLFFQSKVSLDIALLLFGGAHTFRIVLGKQALK